MVSYLENQPFTLKLRERHLAQIAGLGLSQFTRLFQADMLLTPKKYLDLRRREACKRMLVKSSLPLKQIACVLGFGHASDFSAWFRKHYGLSPREFRNRFSHRKTDTEAIPDLERHSATG